MRCKSITLDDTGVLSFSCIINAEKQPPLLALLKASRVSMAMPLSMSRAVSDNHMMVFS